MPIFRLIILTLIIGTAYYLYRRIKNSTQLRKLNKRDSNNSTKVVKCQTCGLHIPKNEAIERSENFYCCEEHIK